MSDMALTRCTEVRFANFLSGGFTTMAVIKQTGKMHLCALCSGKKFIAPNQMFLKHL
jgi:hypothetical protein